MFESPPRKETKRPVQGVLFKRMARGGSIGYKRKTRNKVLSETKCSDESDEDYKVDEDEEFCVSEDEFSFAEDESEDSLGLEEEYDEWVEKKVKKVGRQGTRGKKKNNAVKQKKAVCSKEQNNSNYFYVAKQRKKNMESYNKKEGDEFVVLHSQEQDEHCEGKLRKKSQSSRREMSRNSRNENPRVKYKVPYEEEMEESNFDDSYEDDDESKEEDEHCEEKLRKNSHSSRREMSQNSRNENPGAKYEVLYEEEMEDSDFDHSCEDDDESKEEKHCEEKVRKKSQSSRKELSRNSLNENPGAKYTVPYEEEMEDSDFDVSCEEDDEIKEEDEDCEEKLRKKLQSSRKKKSRNYQNENPRMKDKVLYKEEMEDSDFDDSCEDNDEEFTPGEVLITSRKPVKKRVLRRRNMPNMYRKVCDEFLILPKNNTSKGWAWGRKRRRKVVVNSDSDFGSSGSSDYEYTVSEEERQQVKEAAEFCKRLATRSRSSRPSKIRKEEEILPSIRKRLGRKGKQKEVELEIEVGKQVCRICLSEEGKRTVRGVLNCCSHYFCFACIMEWSKVESRCPLCKQRFSTISRTARAEGQHDLRDAIFPVPERDQVYQPSEEELQGYLDPYENVRCTECLQGGDDALMLLCDLCDSPAHTYCVGLGREVPDGNWYCDGCRPTVVSSSNAQTMNPVPDYGPFGNMCIGSPPVSAVRETFDLNEAYVPDTPLSQETGHYQSPRHSGGHFQATSPVAGSGVFTLFERRRLQRQIHHMLRIRQIDRSFAMNPVPSIRLFGSPIGQDRVIATQNDLLSARTARRNVYLRERFPDFNTPSTHSREASRLRDEALYNQASTSTDQSSGGLLLSEFSGINARIGAGVGHSQSHPCSGMSNAVSNPTTSQFQFIEITVPSRTLQPTP